VVRHIFQAYRVWIYTQSNITSIIFTWIHYTNTEKIRIFIYWHNYMQMPNAPPNKINALNKYLTHERLSTFWKGLFNIYVYCKQIQKAVNLSPLYSTSWRLISYRRLYCSTYLQVKSTLNTVTLQFNS
jgi:hypothetical protein